SNGGTTDHTSTSDASGWDSGALAPPHAPNSCPYPPCGDVPGATFQFRFVNAGTYAYHCSFHSALGMKGVVIVAPCLPPAKDPQRDDEADEAPRRHDAERRAEPGERAAVDHHGPERVVQCRKRQRLHERLHRV